MRIALIGYGIENASVYRYLIKQHPQAEFTVYDEREAPGEPLPEGVGFVGGLSAFTDIDADLLVRTPGMSPYKIHTDTPVTSATKLFFEACRLPIIGVTGSKGKGTTVSLIASILTAGNVGNWVVGNIGNPALDMLGSESSADVVVYELSSFQLWDLAQSPGTAVVLMIEPEHLDVHKDLDDYINAKANIARWQKQGDRLIYKVGNEYAERIARLSPGKVTAYPDSDRAHIEADSFYYGATKLGPISDLPLPGRHNVDNAVAAIDAAWPYVNDPATIMNGLRAFTGLPHRLKFVAEHDAVTYYDDSIATTPGSAIAAIHAFEQPKILILGGSSKGADFHELGRLIASDTVRHAVLIGDEAPALETALRDAGFTDFTTLREPSMDTIVACARDHAQTGDVVILSPACASFGLFRNYSDRGDQFICAVNGLL
jgi:UDP-N-acetylmuramoylalanine--D-glutamate ligase